MFLPVRLFTAVFPPTDESTIAKRVVGTWIYRTPLRKVAAMKPTMSPIEPPPIATRTTFLSQFKFKRSSSITAFESLVFSDSPPGMKIFSIAGGREILW